MSRSIGDSVAKQVGVIATPDIRKLSYRPGCHQFLILATDGVTDAMHPLTIANFVQKYRSRCLTNVNKLPTTSIVSTSNSTIAQLLCEEARMNWFDIVRTEDVMIDDISALIIEIGHHIDETLLEEATPDLEELDTTRVSLASG
jgi:serine/threonine protein phosphatase PrpC